jgi:hypothetical protein
VSTVPQARANHHKHINGSATANVYELPRAPESGPSRARRRTQPPAGCRPPSPSPSASQAGRPYSRRWGAVGSRATADDGVCARLSLNRDAAAYLRDEVEPARVIELEVVHPCLRARLAGHDQHRQPNRRPRRMARFGRRPLESLSFKHPFPLPLPFLIYIHHPVYFDIFYSPSHGFWPTLRPSPYPDPTLRNGPISYPPPIETRALQRLRHIHPDYTPVVTRPFPRVLLYTCSCCCDIKM